MLETLWYVSGDHYRGIVHSNERPGNEGRENVGLDFKKR
jgi:hypothetical protein